MDDPISFGLINVLALFLAFALVLLNALFVAAEFAFVRSRTTRLAQFAEGGNSSARLAQGLIGRMDASLAVSQLGITLASLGLGWLGEPALARLIEPILAQIGVTSPAAIHTTAFVIAFGSITFLHVVFGELVPKSLAIQRAEAVSMWCARPMQVFSVVFYPAIWLLNGFANRFLRLFGLEPASEHERAHTEEELRMLVAESYQSGHLKKSERDLLQNVFDFERRIAREVMLPRPEVVFLDMEAPLEVNLKLAQEAGHTRFPLCVGDMDHVTGLVHIKDLFGLSHSDTLETIRREIMAVPEGMPLDRLLRQFQRNRQHMALVVDEYGGTAGIVTLENVLEEIVGQIQDEFDNERPEVVSEPDGSFKLNGRVLVDDIRRMFAISIPDDSDYDTVGGMVFGSLGKRPRVGDKVEIEGFLFEVSEVKGYRITEIRMRPPVKEEVSKAERAV